MCKLKKTSPLLLTLLLMLVVVSELSAQGARNYLVNALGGRDIREYLGNIRNWREACRDSMLREIASIPEDKKEEAIALGEHALTYHWPPITASLYLEYKENGNRTRYSKLEGERNRMFCELVIAELVERKGRFIPQIANGIWALSEQSTWVAPAHIVVQKAGIGLPDLSEPYIDLYAGIIAFQMSTAYLLLHDELHSYSEQVTNRMYAELSERIINPYLAHDDFWWMGFTGKRKKQNNWNIWINTSVLQTALFIEDDEQKLATVVGKTMRSADHFLNGYPDDGGCDEGPTYWNHAGGNLIRYLSLLTSATDGRLSWQRNKFIHRIGSYIYKMQIADSMMVNFADAEANATPDALSVYRYGLYFDDPSMKRYAAYLSAEMETFSELDRFVEWCILGRMITKEEPLAPYPSYINFPNLQVSAGRLEEGTTEGLFFAVKGGHNGESHNHNDVGNFIVYSEGAPVLIDIGVGTYDAKTFSNRRYELWNMQSYWHNVPVINGIQQHPGSDYGATNYTSTVSDDGNIIITCDISDAYPKNAMVTQYQRRLDFDGKENQLILTDNYMLQKCTEPIELHFVSAVPVVPKGNQLLFKDRNVVMEFPEQLLDVVIIEKEIDDDRIQKAWGDSVYLIRLISKKLSSKDSFTISLSGGT